MINKRLINQLNDLKEEKQKLLIIEGIEERDIYNSGINENAVRGLILSILLNYQIPIIYTKDTEDTANFLKVLWKKQEKEKELGINEKKKSKDVNEQMQYIIEGFPGIGPKTAKKLLNHYGTIRNIINAEEGEIKKVIGKKADIFSIINKAYQQEES
jgi:Fanconi anemia group M protein